VYPPIVLSSSDEQLAPVFDTREQLVPKIYPEDVIGQCQLIEPEIVRQLNKGVLHVAVLQRLRDALECYVTDKFRLRHVMPPQS